MSDLDDLSSLLDGLDAQLGDGGMNLADLSALPPLSPPPDLGSIDPPPPSSSLGAGNSAADLMLSQLSGGGAPDLGALAPPPDLGSLSNAPPSLAALLSPPPDLGAIASGGAALSPPDIEAPPPPPDFSQLLGGSNSAARGTGALPEVDFSDLLGGNDQMPPLASPASISSAASFSVNPSASAVASASARVQSSARSVGDVIADSFFNLPDIPFMVLATDSNEDAPEGTLTFLEGEMIEVIAVDDSTGNFLGSIEDGREGWFPRDMCEILNAEKNSSDDEEDGPAVAPPPVFEPPPVLEPPPAFDEPAPPALEEPPPVVDAPPPVVVASPVPAVHSLINEDAEALRVSNSLDDMLAGLTPIEPEQAAPVNQGVEAELDRLESMMTGLDSPKPKKHVLLQQSKKDSSVDILNELAQLSAALEGVENLDTGKETARSKPGSVRDTAPPSLSGLEAPPSLSGLEAPPSLSGLEAPPSLAGLEAPPSLAGLEPPPAVFANLFAPPMIGSLEAPPALSDLEAPPSISQLEAPPRIDQLEAPPRIEHLEAPPSVKDLEGPPSIAGLAAFMDEVPAAAAPPAAASKAAEHETKQTSPEKTPLSASQGDDSGSEAEYDDEEAFTDFAFTPLVASFAPNTPAQKKEQERVKKAHDKIYSALQALLDANRQKIIKVHAAQKQQIMKLQAKDKADAEKAAVATEKANTSRLNEEVRNLQKELLVEEKAAEKACKDDLKVWLKDQSALLKDNLSATKKSMKHDKSGLKRKTTQLKGEHALRTAQYQTRRLLEAALKHKEQGHARQLKQEKLHVKETTNMLTELMNSRHQLEMRHAKELFDGESGEQKDIQEHDLDVQAQLHPLAKSHLQEWKDMEAGQLQRQQDDELMTLNATLAQEFKVAMKEHNKKKKNKSKDFETQHKVVARQKRKTMGKSELKKFMVTEKEKFSTEIATEEQDFEAKLLSQQEKRRQELKRKHNLESDELRSKHEEQDAVLQKNQAGEKGKLDSEMGKAIKALKSKIKAGIVSIMERHMQEALKLADERSAVMLELVKKQTTAKLAALSERHEELVKLIQDQHSEISASPHTSLTPAEEQDLADVKTKYQAERAALEEQEAELLRVFEKDSATVREELVRSQEQELAKTKA